MDLKKRYSWTKRGGRTDQGLLYAAATVKKKSLVSMELTLKKRIHIF